MGGIGADELRQHRLELEAEVGEALSENAVRGLSLPVGVRPCVHQCADRLVAVEIADRHFQHVGGGSPPHSRDANPILPPLRELNRGEIRDAVGRDILGGIPHLIHELLLHARHADATAGAAMLGDLEGPVRSRIDEETPLAD